MVPRLKGPGIEFGGDKGMILDQLSAIPSSFVLEMTDGPLYWIAQVGDVKSMWMTPHVFSCVLMFLNGQIDAMFGRHPFQIFANHGSSGFPDVIKVYSREGESVVPCQMNERVRVSVEVRDVVGCDECVFG